MPGASIKSGQEVVASFLQAIKADARVDPTTLECIIRLREEKLTKGALLTELHKARGGDNSSDHA